VEDAIAAVTMTSVIIISVLEAVVLAIGLSLIDVARCGGRLVGSVYFAFEACRGELPIPADRFGR
jgi:hypothetical protein